MTERCPHVGTLLIGGHPVGELRCELDAGHDVDVPPDYSRAPWWVEPGIPATPHRATFEWEDELPVVLDAPEEGIEVEVPIVNDADR